MPPGRRESDPVFTRGISFAESSRCNSVRAPWSPPSRKRAPARALPLTVWIPSRIPSTLSSQEDPSPPTKSPTRYVGIGTDRAKLTSFLPSGPQLRPWTAACSRPRSGDASITATISKLARNTGSSPSRKTAGRALHRLHLGGQHQLLRKGRPFFPAPCTLSDTAPGDASRSSRSSRYGADRWPGAIGAGRQGVSVTVFQLRIEAGLKVRFVSRASRASRRPT